MNLFIRSWLLFVCNLFLVTANAKVADQCIDGGRIVHLHEIAGSSDVSVSKDRSFAVITAYEADSFKILDLKTNKITAHPKPASSSVSILDSGEIAYTPFDSVDITSAPAALKAMKKAKTVLINPKTGAKKEVIGKITFGKQLVTPIASEGKHTLVVKNDAGKEKRVVLYDEGSDTIGSFSDEPNDPDITYNKKSKILKIQDGKTVLYSGKIDLGQTEYLPGGLAPNKKKFITSVEKRTGESVESYSVAVVDIDKKTQKVFPLPASYQAGNFESEESSTKVSQDSRHLLLHNFSSSNAGISSIDLETGEITKRASFEAYDPYFDDSGNICGQSTGSAQGKSIRECFDFKTGRSVSKIEVPFDAGDMKSITPNDFIVNIWGWGGGQTGQTYYFSNKKICPKIITPVECDCTIKKEPNLTPAIDVVKDLAVVAACSKDFAANDWKNLPSSDLKSIDEKSSLTLLKRFSKPGGFDPDQHTGILLGMLQVGLHTKYPKEFKGALGGVIFSSDRLYDSLLTKYPDIAKLSGKLDQSCQTAKEKEVITVAIADYAKSRILSSRRPKFSDYEAIVSLAKDSLPDTKKESLAELAADQLVFSAGDSPELNRVFPSKVYKFAENKMKVALGLKHKDLTDVTVVRDGNNLVFYQLGVQPFGDSKETVAGFHIKSVKTISVESLPDNKSVESFKWKYGGKDYSAQIEINKQKLEREIVSSAKAPNYNDMWKGKEFRGVIIAGTNLGTGLTDSVMKEYIEYYTQQGFKFGEPTTSEDIPKFLQDSVSGAKPMHYFVKEAHSDGDEKNLFRVSQAGKVLRGVRTVGDKKEIVDLVYPTGGAKSTLLSNQDFGKWVKEREKSGKPELIYFNSSCWSTSKAVYEISAAASPKLINIPTTTSMYTFTNSEKSAMRIAIDGVRNRKSYEAIRKDLENDPKYASKTANILIFPDEDEYKRQITGVLKVPIDVNPRLFVQKPDGTQAPYSIEDTN